MNTSTLEVIPSSQLTAVPVIELAAMIPEPSVDTPYKQHYQAGYPSKAEVAGAVSKLRGGETVTTFDDVDATQDRLTAVATGESDEKIAIGGPCADRLRFFANQLLRKAGGAVLAGLGTGMRIARERRLVEGQGYTYFTRYLNTGKPRSNEKQKHTDGSEVTSWYGDLTNGKHIKDRLPDPERMLHARDVGHIAVRAARRLAGEHVPVANEMLSLPYILGMLRADARTGKLYCLASDIVWLGNRTNDPAGIHAHIASMLANPVGVKLGPGTPPEKVAALVEKLNPRTARHPNRVPGRLTFVLRMGDREDDIRSALQTVREHDPQAIILFDPHGSTEDAGNGTKVRVVATMIKHIELLARLCHEQDLPLGGILSESSLRGRRRECVDKPEELPRHKPDVDPLVNRRQHRHLLAAAAPLAGHQALRQYRQKQLAIDGQVAA